MVLGHVARVINCHPKGRLDVVYDGGQHTAYSLALPCTAKPGDWVLVHTGFIAGRLSEAQARALMREKAEHRQVAS